VRGVAPPVPPIDIAASPAADADDDAVMGTGARHRVRYLSACVC
jgi:hypothetical protein